MPDFLIEDLKLSLLENFEEIMNVLKQRAPVFVRVNTIKTDLIGAIKSLKNEENKNNDNSPSEKAANTPDLSSEEEDDDLPF